LLTGSADAYRRAANCLVQAMEAREGHLWAGILGAKYVLHALTAMGRADLAFAAVAKTGFPGWGHMIRNGATALWEQWSGEGSRMHHMFSDVGAWMYKALAGIQPDPDRPGFEHVVLRPNVVGGLEWVEASHDSPFGKVAIHWRKGDGTTAYDIEVPPGACATAMLEGGAQDPPRAQPACVDPPIHRAGRWHMTLPAGTHHVAVPHCRRQGDQQ
jgi:alpha-L-rhamnosidase